MPQITNVTLHSFSSEDPDFPAKNLIETKITKKWKCERAGEKSVFVILKLDKPYKLTQIDIGNEFTGVIEILVGNSLKVPPTFQEIILATSLMTIFDAKNERNPNGVRMFGRDLFNPAVADTQWDLIKIICSQPFNNHKQFGLSFINLHTNEEVTPIDEDDSPIKSKIPTIQKPREEKTPKVVPKATTKIGKFRFRDSNSDDEEETSPFAQWKNKKDNPQSTNSKVTPKSDSKFSIKEQLKEKLESESKRRKVDDDDKTAKIKQDRNRSKGLFYDSSDDEPNEKLQKKIEKDKELRNSTQKLPVKPTPTKSAPSTSKYSSFLNDDDDRKRPSVLSPQRHKLKDENTTQKKPDKEIKYKPFNKLMEGVTFVISGYQNPERGIIRQKALDMGAKYKADWDDNCTHLICAYSNTPKYNQVRGKGKIISKKWIENCFIEQKKISWRKFALDNSEKNKPESEDEILSEWHKPKSTTDIKDEKMEQSDDSDGDMLIVDRRGQKNNAKIIIDSDSESDMAIVDKTNKNNIKDDKMDSKQDNDDDYNINRFKDEQQQPQNIDVTNNNKNEMETDVYSDDDSVSSIDITTVECQAFKDKIFYLNEDLSATDKIKLRDNIKHMLGIVTKNPHKAHYIISKQGKKLPTNFKAEVVKEIWIRECFDLQAFIPTTRYRI
ncbi:DNA repair protein XRCC1 [Chironomus tepperi]|uniref:DNA repair protein XRCC1 n=1 Tax=Chironomus tepperi TaxID=113505 RepID=UPI00391F5404